MKQGRVFVPARLAAELFRCTVTWNAAERSVTVNVPVS